MTSLHQDLGLLSLKLLSALNITFISRLRLLRVKGDHMGGLLWPGIALYLPTRPIQITAPVELTLTWVSNLNESQMAHQADDAMCNSLSDIFSIRSSYITKPSVVSESGVKMVSKHCFVCSLHICSPRSSGFPYVMTDTDSLSLCVYIHTIYTVY